MLVAENLVFSYKNKKIFDSLSLCVGERERVGILAPSGFGKTTLLRLLGGYSAAGFRADCGGWFPSAEEGILSGTADLAASGEGGESQTADGEDAAGRRRSGSEAGGEAGDSAGMENAFSKGTVRRRAAAILHCAFSGPKPDIRSVMRSPRCWILITQGQIWRFLIEETKRRGIGMVIASHSRELLDYVCTRQIDLTDSGRKEEEYGYDANGRAGSVDQI